MKKPLAYSVMVVLFILGIGLGKISVELFEGTYAQEQAAPSNQTKDIGRKPVTDSVSKDTYKPIGDPIKDQNTVPPSEPPDAGDVDVALPNEPLGEKLSWWFKRNNKHLPPVVDEIYKKDLVGNGYYLGDTAKKKIYLTFDEGYENGNTGKILDILRRNEVEAAFFVTGKYIDDNPELVKRMVSEGHIVGNHTENHPSMPTIDNNKIKVEIESVDKKFFELTGKEMNYFRPPMGEYNSRTLKTTKLLGYDTIFWSMAYRDWDTKNQPGREVAFQHVMDNIHNGAIILLHAVSVSNTEALDDILKSLKAQGYDFASLDELA